MGRALVFIGLESGQGAMNVTPALEREGHDRDALTLPGVQLPLVQVREEVGARLVIPTPIKGAWLALRRRPLPQPACRPSSCC